MAVATLRERYRTQRFPIWVGVNSRGFAVFVRLPDGGVHFGVKFVRDRVTFGNQREAQYGVALWARRNRRGKKGTPHALTIKVFAS